MNLPIIPKRKTIKVTVTTTREVEITFPYVTFYESLNTYYFNNAENSCIIINKRGVEIMNCNFGLEYPEVKPTEAFKLMDQTILTITEALNK
jgi:hypothetical protein